MRKNRVMSEAILDETGRLADSFESGDFDTDDLVAIAGQARLFVDTVRVLMTDRDEAHGEVERLRGLVETLFDSRSKAEADSDTAFAERDAARAEVKRLDELRASLVWDREQLAPYRFEAAQVRQQLDAWMIPTTVVRTDGSTVQLETWERVRLVIEQRGEAASEVERLQEMLRQAVIERDADSADLSVSRRANGRLAKERDEAQVKLGRALEELAIANESCEALRKALIAQQNSK